MAKDFSIWVEEFRPSTIDELIVPDATEQFLRTLKSEGTLPNLLLSGPAGTGKTATAQVIINELGLADAKLHLNCSMHTSIHDIRTRVQNFATTYSILGDEATKVAILDEADRLSLQAMDSLKGFIEETYKICRFIFITNHVSKIIPPLISRLQHFPYGEITDDKKDLQKKMLKRSFMILSQKNVDYDKMVVWEIVQKLFPDFRSIINHLQKSSKAYGEINDKSLNIIDQSRVGDIVDLLKNKKYSGLRKIASEMDSTVFFSTFYDELESLGIENDCKPEIIYLLAEGARWDGISTNKESNLFDVLLRLAGSIVWKKE